MTGQPDPGATSAEEHGAGVDLLVEQAPPGSVDRDREHREQTPEEDALQGAGALEILRRGVAATPELRVRSEEHTSELQSLMRISYAVLCVNKKTHKTTER